VKLTPNYFIQIGYTINALALMYCLSAMEFIPTKFNDVSYFIGSRLYQYLAVLTMNGHAVMSR
jgi:hypothetical protein